MITKIVKGDIISISHKGNVYIGIAVSGRFDQRSKTYRIKIDVKAGNSAYRGYTYWEQKQEGGSVELLHHFSNENAEAYIEGWGHTVLPATNGFRIKWVGGQITTHKPDELIAIAGNIWLQNEFQTEE